MYHPDFLPCVLGKRDGMELARVVALCALAIISLHSIMNNYNVL